jgi:hypothetical protein
MQKPMKQRFAVTIADSVRDRDSRNYCENFLVRTVRKR